MLKTDDKNLVKTCRAARSRLNPFGLRPQYPLPNFSPSYFSRDVHVEKHGYVAKNVTSLINKRQGPRVRSDNTTFGNYNSAAR